MSQTGNIKTNHFVLLKSKNKPTTSPHQFHVGRKGGKKEWYIVIHIKERYIFGIIILCCYKL